MTSTPHPGRVRRGTRSTGLRCLSILLTLVLPSGLDGQSPGDGPERVSAFVELGGALVGGEFEDTRTNGKRVRADLAHAVALRVGVVVPVGGLRIEAGIRVLESSRLRIEQEFPDETDFAAVDRTEWRGGWTGIRIGVARSERAMLDIVPTLLIGSWSAVSVPSAGPPWDRSLPLDLEPETSVGGGVEVRGEFRLTDRIRATGRASLTRLRFRATIEDDPSEPGTAGEVDLDANPLEFTLGLSWSLPGGGL